MDTPVAPASCSLSPGQQGEPEQQVLAKLFVGGLSWQVGQISDFLHVILSHHSHSQTSSDRLREYFEQFGEVEDVLIMKDPVTQVKIEDWEKRS